jgi:hypothetical protein
VATVFRMCGDCRGAARFLRRPGLTVESSMSMVSGARPMSATTTCAYQKLNLSANSHIRPGI